MLVYVGVDMIASFAKFSGIQRLLCQKTPLGFVAFFAVACWAPEVEPPTPKKSPAELAGLAISSVHAEIPILLETTTDDGPPTIAPPPKKKPTTLL